MANTDPASVLTLPTYRWLEVAPVRNGLGIVARRAFRPGAMVCEIRGKVTNADTLWRYWETDPQRAENCFRYDADNYLDPAGEIAQYANHSCNPNTGIQKWGSQLVLIARDPITRGDEVTHDYSTLLGADDVWRMPCNCGEKKCRKTVRNIKRLSAGTFWEYADQNIIPDYILATLLAQR